jgi:long-subunit fatty acid transport protein
MRTNFSGAFIIAKKGVLSVDYELINYGKAKFYDGGDGLGFSEQNTDIGNTYKSSGNLRVGGEYKVSNAVSLRGGYELQMSAYNDYSMDSPQPNSNANINVYSGGLGYRSGPFFADVSYRYSVLNDYILPYANPIQGRFTYPEPQFIEQKTVRNNVLLSLGFRF